MCAQLPGGGDQPRLPVLVWVHGGGFRMGDGDVGLYGPEFLMDVGGIVTVTLNYRVGPFGKPQLRAVVSQLATPSSPPPS